MFTTLRLDFRPDAVAVLTFDQPGSKANVLTSQMWTDLEAAVDSLAARTDLKGLVLASAKPGIFIAGADLKLLADAPAPNDPAVRAFIEHGLRVLEKLEALPFPTCAAIDGAALGGGLEVALACDTIVAGCTDDGAKPQLGLPEVNLGLIPGWGGTQRLSRQIALRRPEDALNRAAQWLTFGRSYPIREVAQFEFVDTGYRATGTQQLVDCAAESLLKPGLVSLLRSRRASRRLPLPADSLAAFIPPTALTGAAAEAVRVLTEGAALALADAIKLETAAFMTLAGSPESKALIAAFFASRKKPA